VPCPAIGALRRLSSGDGLASPGAQVRQGSSALTDVARQEGARPEGTTPVEQDWIDAARQMLVEGGVAAVQINPLAARLSVTRGGFYWRFRNRRHLLNELLDDWEARNTRHFLETAGPPGTPAERYSRLVQLWLDEKDFDPALDAAVRHWGSIDPSVRDRVRAADLARIEGLADIFLKAGQPPLEAGVRARIVYFHQIGYYALGLGESRAERDQLVETYTRILAGFA
jgi:AcrR family transcriptional regulator